MWFLRGFPGEPHLMKFQGGKDIVERLNKSHELGKHLLCTVVILGLFLAGRNIMLYRVDVSAFSKQSQSVQGLLVNMISGDRNRCSVFALGIMPYMTASIFIQFGVAFMPESIKKKISKRKMDNFTYWATFLLACFWAYSRTTELTYLRSGSVFDKTGLQILSFLEMLLGAMIIVVMLNVNKDKGIGQQTPIILVNIIEGLYTTIAENYADITWVLVFICFGALVITVVMENVEVRLPVQRVSINNVYADKNYIAFKLNPIGIMPVMFATSVFMLIKYILYFIGGVIPDNQTLLHINANMDFTSRLGILVYLGVIVLFTILFSFVMLTPGTMAEGLQKNGDSIVGIYAGRATTRYLRLVLLALSIISGIVLAACMSVSLFLALREDVIHEVAMLPSSLMIFVGIITSFFDEANGYIKFDLYKFFI